MKRKFYIVLALLLAALLAQFFFSDTGYVAVHAGSFLIETSLPGAVLALIAAYFVVRAAIKVIRAPALMQLAADNRRRERARRDLVQGLMEL